MKQIILIFLLAAVSVTSLAQPDKRDVRRGNRDFRKENYKEAEIEYRKAIVKDSLSIAANYNLAADLYRQGNPQEAAKVLDRIKEAAQSSEYAADYFYNLGDVAIANQDWKTAVDAFRESLLRNPGDLDAKENYIYARKKLQEQQDQQQNQDQNQQNDQNQDNKDDQNKDDQQKDDQQDQNKDNQQDQQKDQQQEEDQPKISPQAAQQMLQAIQAKEKETQEKVKKEKAQALQSRQKERNW